MQSEDGINMEEAGSESLSSHTSTFKSHVMLISQGFHLMVLVTNFLCVYLPTLTNIINVWYTRDENL